MTSFTSAVTGAGRKLNNYDFDLRVGFPDGQRSGGVYQRDEHVYPEDG